MTRVAGIDCGTNSIRLLVSDVDAQGKTDVHREMRVNRLGQGVDRTRVLAEDALERTREAMEAYAVTCRYLGVEPEVVTGEEEAALSFAGATSGLPAGDGPFLVIDIGGGSTELVLGTTAVEASVSVDVGCVRLTERHLRTDPPTREEVLAAERDIDAAVERIRAALPLDQATTAIGVAGSVTTVAAMALRLPAYDSDAIHGTRMSADVLSGIATDLLGLTRAQRAGIPVMHPGRVDVIGAGALVLRTLVRRLGLEEVLVSEADILDGIVLSLR